MKTIGLLGGMSWESTADYYRLINQHVRTKLGGLHSAKIVLFSVDFAEIQQLQGRWEEAGVRLAEVAKQLEQAKVDFILICSNTMHKVFEQVQRAVQVPVLHIAEATAAKINEKKVKKVLLLGTKFTMEENFIKNMLTAEGIECLVPDAKDRAIVHNVIFHELVQGVVKDSSRNMYQEIIAKGAALGADGVILGCTEIGMLIRSNDTQLQIFDTTQIHAELAVHRALS